MAGNVKVTARFEEFERYDPITDRECIRFMCITNMGTYHAEVPRYDAPGYRKQKERFRMLALDAIQSGLPPQEISMVSH